MTLSQTLIDSTALWVPRLALMWQQEVPMRLHGGGIADDGSPRMSADFARWLLDERPRPGQRPRITHAMRRLRKMAIREFEVAYRIIVLGHDLPSTAEWLDERAIRHGHPERYTVQDVGIILASAIDKLLVWSN